MMKTSKGAAAAKRTRGGNTKVNERPVDGFPSPNPLQLASLFILCASLFCLGYFSFNEAAQYSSNSNHASCRSNYADGTCFFHEPSKAAAPGTICLNMIVKNEVRVLPRLFKSVKDYIDHYVIVDTGSSDETISLIQDTMARYGIPGQVHERPWVNFGVNRQQAMDLAVAYDDGAYNNRATCDWLLFIDADEELGVSDRNFKKTLTKGTSYTMSKNSGMTNTYVLQLLDVSEHTWKWEGVVHSYPTLQSGVKRIETLSSVWTVCHSMEGSNSHGVTVEQKFLRDAALLQAELKRNPNDSRSQFYLAQSYKDAGPQHYQKAYDAYKKRIAMPNTWQEEIFFSHLVAGVMAEVLGMPQEMIVSEWVAAAGVNPRRAEPFWYLANYFRRQKEYAKATANALKGALIPLPDSSTQSTYLFVLHDMYDWKILDELCISAYYVQRYTDGEKACQEILDRVESRRIKDVPDQDVARIKDALTYYHQIAKTTNR